LAQASIPPQYFVTKGTVQWCVHTTSGSPHCTVHTPCWDQLVPFPAENSLILSVRELRSDWTGGLPQISREVQRSRGRGQGRGPGAGCLINVSESISLGTVRLSECIDRCSGGAGRPLHRCSGPEATRALVPGRGPGLGRPALHTRRPCRARPLPLEHGHAAGPELGQSASGGEQRLVNTFILLETFQYILQYYNIRK
jgi:hypothetical protein